MCEEPAQAHIHLDYGSHVYWYCQTRKEQLGRDTWRAGSMVIDASKLTAYAPQHHS